MASENDWLAVEPRLRMQWLDDEGRRVRIAFQPSPDQAWNLEELSSRQSDRYMKLAKIEDVREWSELGMRARAARREWGHEGGFAEWTPRFGARRFPGDLFQAVND